jgi:hypothetical protein
VRERASRDSQCEPGAWRAEQGRRSQEPASDGSHCDHEPQTIDDPRIGIELAWHGGADCARRLRRSDDDRDEHATERRSGHGPPLSWPRDQAQEAGQDAADERSEHEEGQRRRGQWHQHPRACTIASVRADQTGDEPGQIPAEPPNQRSERHESERRETP